MNIEEALLKNLVLHKKETITQVYQAYFKPCAQVVLRDGGLIDDAREVFQEAIYSLMLKLEDKDFSIRSNLKAYLNQSCFNIWVATKRKRRRLKAIESVGEIESEEENTTQQQQNEKRYELMYEEIKKLSNECQDSIRLFYLEDKEDKEIAPLLNYTLQFVRQKRRRCMDKLKKRIFFNKK